jgi:hypothetical protein
MTHNIDGLIERLRAESASREGWPDTLLDEAADQLEALKPMIAERERLREALSHAEQVLTKYRDETPLGHQPHMIALVADRAISAARAALTQSGEGS